MFKHVKESQVSLTELMLPSHSNFSGKIHGGHILNLMDQIAFACASKHSRNYCVTASVNKVDFYCGMSLNSFQWLNTGSILLKHHQRRLSVIFFQSSER